MTTRMPRSPFPSRHRAGVATAAPHPPAFVRRIVRPDLPAAGWPTRSDRSGDPDRGDLPDWLCGPTRLGGDRPTGPTGFTEMPPGS